MRFAENVSVQSGTPWGPYVAIALSLALVFWVVRDGQEIVARLRGRDRAILLFTRTLTALLGLALLWQPQWLREHLQRGVGDVVLLMDTSRSMSLPGQESSRAAQAQEVLRAFRRSVPDAQTFAFGADAHAMQTLAPHGQYPTNENETRILQSLKSVIASAGDELGAIVLVSDGADTSGDASMAAFRALGVRVHTVAIGGRGRVCLRITSR